MALLFNKLISASKRFNLQTIQYTERIPLSGTVPADGVSHSFPANVTNLGHFFCLFMTGKYETLSKVTFNAVDKIVDDGICHLRAQIVDGGNGEKLLFQNYAPLDLFLSPGRERSATAENNLLDVSNYALRADPAPQLWNSTEFNYMFSANSDIIVRIKNDSNVDLNFDMLFYGVRRLSAVSTTGIKKD